MLPHVADGMVPQLRQVIDTGEPIIEGTAYVETPAHPGRKRIYDHNYYPHKSAGETVLGVSCVVRDITTVAEALRIRDLVERATYDARKLANAEAPEGVVADLRHMLEDEGYLTMPDESRVRSLSERELQVFQMIGRGNKPTQIAEKLQLSVRTIETYQANIKRKLDVRGATRLWLSRNSRSVTIAPMLDSAYKS